VSRPLAVRTASIRKWRFHINHAEGRPSRN
jgi:hypothetical protein